MMKKEAKQKRGRPRKSVEQMDREIDLTVRLVKEIHELSKKSYLWLSTELFNGTITGESLRQYGSGHKVASISRRRQIASAANKHGFGGIEAARAARKSGLMEEDLYRDHYRRVMEKEEQKAVALAEKGVAALANVLCAEDATSLLLSMVARLCHPYVDVDE